MDWIDPRYATVTEEVKSVKKSKKKKKVARTSSRKGRPLVSQVRAALAQPLEVWSVAFDHALSALKWPTGCGVESSFLWSTLMVEQAEILVRAGMSAKKLSAIVSESQASNGSERAEQLAEVVGLMDKPLETTAFQWLETADSYPCSALGVSALAWHVPDHARRAGNGWLTQWLQSVADEIGARKVDRRESIICQLVLQCELPLLVGLATTASKRAALVEANRAMDNLAEFLERSEDSSAPWLAHGAIYLRAALACVLRCRVLANALGLRKWYPVQQKALGKLLNHAARWARNDGTQLLGAGTLAPKSKATWEALANLSKASRPMQAAMTLSGIGSGKRAEAKTKVAEDRLPALSHYSAPSSSALMQSDWREKCCRVAVDFSDTEICLEVLGAKGESILAGEWTARVDLDGQAQLRLDDWHEVCWFSDADVDYLELESHFGQSAKVQRQIVLLRESRLLLLADSLLGEVDDTWTLESKFPLAAGAGFESNKKSTEGFVTTYGGVDCFTVPLFLPEWRRQLSLAGSKSNLFQEDGDLISRVESKTQRIYMPVVFQIGKPKLLQQFTWRHLTVADELRIVESKEAQAYRLQINQDQWLFYRSLAEPKRRTALGMHTMADFFAGAFDADEGEVDTIVEVEAS